MQGSLWAEAQKSDEASKYLQFSSTSFRSYSSCCCFPQEYFMFILFLFCLCPRAPEFDMTELENLFAATIPNNGSTGGKSNRRGSGPKSEKVNLVIEC